MTFHHLSSCDLFHSESIVQQWARRKVLLGKFFDDHNSHVWIIQLVEEGGREGEGQGRMGGTGRGRGRMGGAGRGRGRMGRRAK